MDGIIIALLPLLVAWLAFAVFTAWIATQKGRSGCGWFLLGAIFGIFALIGIAIVPSAKKDA